MRQPEENLISKTAIIQRAVENATNDVWRAMYGKRSLFDAFMHSIKEDLNRNHQINGISRNTSQTEHVGEISVSDLSDVDMVNLVTKMYKNIEGRLEAAYLETKNRSGLKKLKTSTSHQKVFLELPTTSRVHQFIKNVFQSYSFMHNSYDEKKELFAEYAISTMFEHLASHYSRIKEGVFSREIAAVLKDYFLDPKYHNSIRAGRSSYIIWGEHTLPLEKIFFKLNKVFPGVALYYKKIEKIMTQKALDDYRKLYSRKAKAEEVGQTTEEPDNLDYQIIFNEFADEGLNLEEIVEELALAEEQPFDRQANMIAELMEKIGNNVEPRPANHGEPRPSDMKEEVNPEPLPDSARPAVAPPQPVFFMEELTARLNTNNENIGETVEKTPISYTP